MCLWNWFANFLKTGRYFVSTDIPHNKHMIYHCLSIFCLTLPLPRKGPALITYTLGCFTSAWHLEKRWSAAAAFLPLWLYDSGRVVIVPISSHSTWLKGKDGKESHPRQHKSKDNIINYSTHYNSTGKAVILRNVDVPFSQFIPTTPSAPSFFFFLFFFLPETIFWMKE